MKTPITGLLVDLDGTVYEAGKPIPGARRTIEWLRAREVPFLFTTNTSRTSRRAVVDSLGRLGVAAEQEEVLTAPVTAARWLEAEGLRRVQLLLPGATHEDFGRLEIVEERPDAVVVGDLGDGFEFWVLNAAFRSLRDGARLVAVHKNRFWITESGPTLDAGPFVVALEYAAQVESVLVGKPSPNFFRTAASLLGVERDGLAVVGDDPESDVAGARAAGLTAIQVRTGKYDVAGDEGVAVDEPDEVIASIADLPRLLVGFEE